MPILTATPRLLVKAEVGISEASLAFGSDRIVLKAEPLFTSIGRAEGLGALGASQWHILTLADAAAADEANAWDLCHALLTEGLGVAGAPAPEFAEPDLQQQWIIGDERRQSFAMGSTCEAPEPQDDRFPRDPDPFWFRNASHSELATAAAAIGDPPQGPRVRIAQLDTGYDPEHKFLPRHLNHALERNFVDPNRPNDASDETEGLLTNLGHGTGTLGILAGGSPDGRPGIGGAPFAEVVPIRVANRVVLFFNSAIAQALDYVHRCAAGRAPASTSSR